MLGRLKTRDKFLPIAYFSSNSIFTQIFSSQKSEFLYPTTVRIFRKTALLLLLTLPLALLYTGQEDLLVKLDNIPFRFQQVIKPTPPAF